MGSLCNGALGRQLDRLNVAALVISGIAMKPVSKTSNGAVQPFLRWAGSKKQMLPVLSQYWTDEYLRYVEPFAGSASMFFRVHPKKALLGDINRDLIATYRQVKTRVAGVISCLGGLTKGRDEYLELRSMETSSLTPAARAARFIYLNRFCFNGLYRTNRSGRFNVPYGGDRAGNLPSDDALRRCSVRLKNADFVAGDFEEVLKNVRLGDFVYMDPPFQVKARRVFNEYDASVFRSEDLHRLRQWLERFADRGIPFLVSYADCEEARFLCRGFHTQAVTVKRNIAGFTRSRVRSSELLISSVPRPEGRKNGA